MGMTRRLLPDMAVQLHAEMSRVQILLLSLLAWSAEDQKVRVPNSPTKPGLTACLSLLAMTDILTGTI
jgi:hypothetical protein